MSRARSHDLVSFDLDGTLVDTASEIAEAANRTLEEHGIARQPLADIERLIGAGTVALITQLLARCQRADPDLAGRVHLDDVLASMDRHYAATTGTLARPYPGCEETLQRLGAAGVRLACVTNKELRHARRVLQASALQAHFALVIGGDSLPCRKPDAEVLWHVARHQGVTLNRMAHVGDSSIDVAAARNAGVSAWAVPYGYNAGRPIADAAPDRIFDTLAQVADEVLG